MSKPRVIAFYLPQFYPTPENDKWWGPGFTEWTNVGNAKPLFKGHYQPRVPANLGYYDLRVPEVRELQAKMAEEAGIEGFCYWHYWFAGKRLLDDVFKEVVEFKTPNYPFCLCWANHSWYKKTWDPRKGKDELLIEQTYPGKEDYIAHFYEMLPAFKDKRYIKVNNKLVFGVYAPTNIPDAKLFIETWQKLAKENGLSGFYFFGFAVRSNLRQEILNSGFNAVVVEHLIDFKQKKQSLLKRAIFRLTRFGKKFIPLNYSDYTHYTEKNYNVSETEHVCIHPNFDHSPRSGNRGVILHNSTPREWGRFCKSIIHKISHRNSESNLLFIKAWNEWGEGNYLEPDLKYGTQYLDELHDAIKSES